MITYLRLRVTRESARRGTERRYPKFNTSHLREEQTQTTRPENKPLAAVKTPLALVRMKLSATSQKDVEKPNCGIVELER